MDGMASVYRKQLLFIHYWMRNSKWVIHLPTNGTMRYSVILCFKERVTYSFSCGTQSPVTLETIRHWYRKCARLSVSFYRLEHLREFFCYCGKRTKEKRKEKTGKGSTMARKLPDDISRAVLCNWHYGWPHRGVTGVRRSFVHDALLSGRISRRKEEFKRSILRINNIRLTIISISNNMIKEIMRISRN